MKLIELTKGKYTKVSDCDYRFLMNFKWYARKRHNHGHDKYDAIANLSIEKRTRFTPTMSKVIMGLPIGMTVDHINGDTLDNRRPNLRICTHIENMRNRKLNYDSITRLKGVGFHKASKKYQARIKVRGKHIYIGLFKCPLLAKMAYNLAATKYHGEFANYG